MGHFVRMCICGECGSAMRKQMRSLSLYDVAWLCANTHHMFNRMCESCVLMCVFIRVQKKTRFYVEIPVRCYFKLTNLDKMND